MWYSHEQSRWYADDCVSHRYLPTVSFKTLELVPQNSIPLQLWLSRFLGTQNHVSNFMINFYTSYQIRSRFGKISNYPHCFLKEIYGNTFSFAVADSTLKFLGLATIKYPFKNIFGKLQSDTIDQRLVILENHLQRLVHTQKPPKWSQDVLILSFLGSFPPQN